MWRCGSLHALFLSFWTKICLIRLWPCYIIGFCSFNVWSVSIDKDCLEVANTRFDYSAWLFSSRRKPYYICFFFKWKFFGNWDQYLTHAMHTKVKFHESRRLGFFAASFFLPLFSNSFFLGKLTLTENSSSPLFSLFLLFSELVSHDVECFYCCNITENGRSMWTERLESNDRDQNNEKRVQFVLSTETELPFFPYN